MSEVDRKDESADGMVDRLYRAALLVSASDTEAAALVEETFRRSREMGLSDPDAASLFQTLWEVAGGVERKTTETDSAADQALNNDRTETALGHARTVVARSFQQLPLRAQTAILLLEVEKLTVAAVASVLQTTEADVVQLHEQALSTFHDVLFTGQYVWKREQLVEDLPDSWIADSLHRVMESLGRAPKDLHSRLDKPGATDKTRVIPPVSGPLLDRHATADISRDDRIRFRSIVVAILLILVVGFGAKFAYDRLAAAPDSNSNVITLTARAAQRFSPDLETDSAERLRRFLSTHLSDDTPMPLIEGMRIVGVGLDEIAPGATIAGMRFVDATTEKSVTVYTFSYRFLEGQSAVRLSNDVLRQIQSDADFDLHDLGKTQVVVWRHRAHIFLAVTELDGRELRPRVYYPAVPSG